MSWADAKNGGLFDASGTSGSWWSEIKGTAQLNRGSQQDYAERVAARAEEMGAAWEGSGEWGGYAAMADPVALSAADSVAAAHGLKNSGDAIGPATGNIMQTNTATGGQGVNESLYGKLDYGPEGSTWGQMASSFMDDVFAVSANATKADPLSTFQAGTWGGPDKGVNFLQGANGPAHMMAGVGGSSAEAPRTDMQGNIIRSDGINDYVEMNGTRFNIGIDGSYRETDLFGQEIQNMQSLGGFGVADAGINSFYGSVPASDTLGFGGVASQPSDPSSFYSTTWFDTSATQTSNVGFESYGLGNTASTWDPMTGGFGNSATQNTDAGSIYGSAWFDNGFLQADTNSYMPADNNMAWWNGGAAAQRQEAQYSAQASFGDVYGSGGGGNDASPSNPYESKGWV